MPTGELPPLASVETTINTRVIRSSSDFLSNLLVLLLRVKNAGLDEHGLGMLSIHRRSVSPVD